MSVTQTLRAVELFRGMGVPVTFEPGWDTRGNGQSSAYQGGILHHTGGSYAATCPGILIHGRSDLSGPLCNFAGLTNGGIHVVAAHPANHAGASGGPNAAPFPITTLFNKLVMGLEICYPGSQPMTNEQYRTAKVFAKVMQIMYGSIERARAHRETSVEGKWDPGFAPGQTINMAELRAAAANVEGDDLSWNDRITVQQGTESWTDPAGTVVGSMAGKVNLLADRLLGDDDADGRDLLDTLRHVRTELGVWSQRDQDVIRQESAALRAAVTTLAEAVAGKTGASPAEIEAAVARAIQNNLVQVDVNVRGT